MERTEAIAVTEDDTKDLLRLKHRTNAKSDSPNLIKHSGKRDSFTASLRLAALIIWLGWTIATVNAQSLTRFDLPIPVARGGVEQWGDYGGDGDYDFLITG